MYKLSTSKNIARFEQILIYVYIVVQIGCVVFQYKVVDKLPILTNVLSVGIQT